VKKILEMSLTIKQRKEICDTFYYFTFLELATKYNTCKSEISNIVTSYLIRDRKTSEGRQRRIEECVKAGFTVNELMIKFKLKHKQAKGFWLLYGSRNIVTRYISNCKEPYYNTEQEMLIPEYNFNGLSESEKIIYKTL